MDHCSSSADRLIEAEPGTVNTIAARVQRPATPRTVRTTITLALTAVDAPGRGRGEDAILFGTAAMSSRIPRRRGTGILGVAHHRPAGGAP